MIETIVKVDGMMCGMCESHVNEAVRKAFPEAKKVTSSQAKGQTVIHSEQPLDEQKLRDAINATGFGPQGFGGATTCLGVCIEQLPTHVACLPVAVNVSCHVTRRASAEV